MRQTTTPEPIVSLKGVTKRFGQILAVDNVDVEIHRGQIVGIVGDNGAGKSTLVRLIAGVHSPDSGQILLDGSAIVLSGPRHARSLGIEMVHQDLALAANLNAAANFFLGRELRNLGFLGWVAPLDEQTMRQRTREELERLRIDLPQDVKAPIAYFSGGQRQAIAVGRSAYWASRVLLMDEPTAALGVKESKQVLDVVRSIRADGVAIVIVSHILPHVLELSDHVVVMRHGAKVADLPGGSTTPDELINLIVGSDAGGAQPIG